VIPEQKARAAQYEQRSRTADGEHAQTNLK
jgi:hypothetical protein